MDTRSATLPAGDWVCFSWGHKMPMQWTYALLQLATAEISRTALAGQPDYGTQNARMVGGKGLNCRKARPGSSESCESIYVCISSAIWDRICHGQFTVGSGVKFPTDAFGGMITLYDFLPAESQPNNSVGDANTESEPRVMICPHFYHTSHTEGVAGQGINNWSLRETAPCTLH